MSSIILIPGVIIVVLIILGILFASRYVTVNANEALIVTGAMTKKNGMKIIKAGGTFVFPIVQNARRMSLELLTLDVHTRKEVYTQQGVPVIVGGVAQIKVRGDEPSIATASEQFLGKPPEQMTKIATETMEGHLRSILGGMTAEAIYKNREQFAMKVQEEAATDLDKMGLQIVSFTIRDVADSHGYFENLGRPQIATVKRNAEIAEAQAYRDAEIAKAQALQEGEQAKLIAQTQIAEASKEKEVKIAQYKAEQDQKKAEADKAYELQQAITMQKVKAEEMNIQVVEREKQIELQDKEILRREKELDATVKKQASADRYAQEQRAEAARFQVEANAKAQAEAIRLEGQANADKVKAEGSAQAEIIKLQGLAEAEAKDALAEALKKYGEAAVLQMIVEQLPNIAREIASPLAKTEKIVIIDQGEGGGGASKVTNYVTDIMAKLPQTLSAVSDIDLTKLLQGFTQLRENTQKGEE